jgi:hypothetical protein
MTPSILAHHAAAAAIWERHKLALLSNDRDFAFELKKIAYLLGKKADELCEQTANSGSMVNKPLSADIQKKIEKIVKKSENEMLH